MSWMATSSQLEKYARASASNVAVLVTLPSSSSRWLTRQMATRVLSMRRPCFRSLQSLQIWPQMPPTIFSSSWRTSLSPWSAIHGGIIGLKLFPAVTLVRRSYMIRRSLRIRSSWGRQGLSSSSCCTTISSRSSHWCVSQNLPSTWSPSHMLQLPVSDTPMSCKLCPCITKAILSYRPSA